MRAELSFLRENPYFTGIDNVDISTIRELFVERTFERKNQITLEGEVAEILYFVYSGAVKIYRTSPDGREQIFEIVRPGESFNDVSVFDGKPNAYSAEAMSRVSLYGVTRDKLYDFIRKNYNFAINVIGVLASRVRRLILLVEDLSFRNVINRVARIIFEYADDNASPRRFTQQEMAGMAGSAREVVARALKELEYRGVLKMDRHRVIITDKKALREIAGII